MSQPLADLPDDVVDEMLVSSTDAVTAAHWAMRKLVQVEMDEKRLEATAAAEIDRIAAWRDGEVRLLEARRASLTEFLRGHHRVLYEGDPRHNRSVGTPYGRFGLRKSQDEWEVTDAEALISWALDEHVELLRIEPALGQLKGHAVPVTATDDLEPGTAVEVVIDGEVVPGVEVTRRPDVFYARPG